MLTAMSTDRRPHY